ncbi:MAG: acylphosphatase [Gemmatimonadales bacterium]|nr:acylphosphatase [Gemmatimonadales bacterium]
MPTIATRRYLISGMVQGVGFRWFTQAEGNRLGVSGWVRNLPSGQVEAVARGTASQLDAFESMLRQGPDGAFVTDLHFSENSDDLTGLTSFEIRS